MTTTTTTTATKSNKIRKTATGVKLMLVVKEANVQQVVTEQSELMPQVSSKVERTDSVKLLRAPKQERSFTLPQFLMIRNQGAKVDASSVKFFEMADIQLALINKNIEITNHAKERMQQRGYTNKDLVHGIWTGTRTQLQFHRGVFKAIVEGLDYNGNPINLVIGCPKFTKQTGNHRFYIDNTTVYEDERTFISSNTLTVISVMPPVEDKFIRHVTHHFSA